MVEIRLLKVILIVILCLPLTSCATVMTGKYQEVPVNSLPSKATAKCEGKTITTPGTFSLRRDKNHTIIISKEGYYEETVILKRTLSGAVAGNAIIGGVIGGAIDMASGAAYKLMPEEVNVQLKKISEEKSQEESSFKTETNSE